MISSKKVLSLHNKMLSKVGPLRLKFLAKLFSPILLVTQYFICFSSEKCAYLSPKGHITLPLSCARKNDQKELKKRSVCTFVLICCSPRNCYGLIHFESEWALLIGCWASWRKETLNIVTLILNARKRSKIIHFTGETLLQTKHVKWMPNHVETLSGFWRENSNCGRCTYWYPSMHQ